MRSGMLSLFRVFMTAILAERKEEKKYFIERVRLLQEMELISGEKTPGKHSPFF